MHVHLENLEQTKNIINTLHFAIETNVHLGEVEKITISDNQFVDSEAFEGCLWVEVKKKNSNHKHLTIVAPNGEVIYL